MVNIAGIGTPAVGAIAGFEDKVDKDKHAIIAKIFATFNEYSVYIFILFIFIFCLGKFFSRKGNTLAWRAIQEQINILQYIGFTKKEGDLNDSHRVTLFKYKSWSFARTLTPSGLKSLCKNRVWPWSGWLVPVVRSGHTGKRTKIVFSAPDSGRKAEGLAGLCWSSDAVVHEAKLPNINNTSSQINKNRYCRKSRFPGWLLELYCKEDRQVARSIFAIPIRNLRGDRWGVLVFDSMQVDGVNVGIVNEAFTIIVNSLGVLLEEV